MKNLSGFAPHVLKLLLLALISTRILPAVEQTDARTYTATGVEELGRDDPYRAIDSFRSALNINPVYAEARLGMAEALYRLGEYEEAFRELDSARTLLSGRRELSLLEARILTALARYTEAENIYRTFLASRPHDAEANRGLAEIFAITGQRELADEAFARSLRYSPQDRRVLLQLVVLHDRYREKTLADAAMQEALRQYPDDLTVRIQAAEHHALYNEWTAAIDHIERAHSMLSGPEDARYPVLAVLDAELALRRENPNRALEALSSIQRPSPRTLFLQARSYRMNNDEESAQNTLRLILSLYGTDEIVGLYRESPLVLTSGGFPEHRREAADLHLKRGRQYEDQFYFQRAYREYRRAKLILKDDPQVWIAYTEILRKMGFTEKYVDALTAALLDIPPLYPEYRTLRRRLDLVTHSDYGSLADLWDQDDPWSHEPGGWRMGIYTGVPESSMNIHPGVDETLGLYIADLLDVGSKIDVLPVDVRGNPRIGRVDSLAQAFRSSRDRVDYFTIVGFHETERTFSATATVYLARTGEEIARFDELRTGEGRVTDTLHVLAERLADSLPDRMSIVSVNGSRVLLDKGSWHGVSTETPWIVLRKGSGRPAAVEGGLAYTASEYLGTVEITKVSEPLSEGTFTRFGDFNFISPGDELFQLPVPENLPESSIDFDPAFKARLLAIP